MINPAAQLPRGTKDTVSNTYVGTGNPHHLGFYGLCLDLGLLLLQLSSPADPSSPPPSYGPLGVPPSTSAFMRPACTFCLLQPRTLPAFFIWAVDGAGFQWSSSDFQNSDKGINTRCAFCLVSGGLCHVESLAPSAQLSLLQCYHCRRLSSSGDMGTHPWGLLKC